MNIRPWFDKRPFQIFLALLACTLLTLKISLFVTLCPTDEEAQRDSACRLVARTAYAIPLAKGDTLFLPLPSDSAALADFDLDRVATAVEQSGAFVSDEGHAVTSEALIHGASDRLAGDTLKMCLERAQQSLQKHKQRLEGELKLLKEYAAYHSVVDDGYNQVMDYRTAQLNALARTDSLLQNLAELRRHSPAEAQRCTRVLLTTKDSTTTEMVLVQRHAGLLLLRTAAGELPEGFARLTVWRWGTTAIRRRLCAFNDFGGTTRSTRASLLGPDRQRYDAAEGAVWLNPLGHLCGVNCRGQRTGSLEVGQLLAKEHALPVWWWRNLRARVAALWERKGATHISQTGNAAADSEVEPARVCTCFVNSLDWRYEGEVALKRTEANRTLPLREGWGRLTWPDGTRFEGRWEADTLAEGLRTDSLGLYAGTFDEKLRAAGYGEEWLRSGEYYAGEWQKGLREGHGFAILQDKRLHCGWWKNGRFHGERMVYTPDRVYGIDISRHQHEKGKKRYTIDWDKLRITSLGPGRRVLGNVDYPVSFVYVKATEGKTVKNKYYAADLRQARSHGIAAGSYHFFRLTSSGAEQAAFFLQNSHIAHSDLPPVLDLEPTDAEVRRGGGDEVMFREALVWLRRVEKACGKRPVLYVGQLFVQNHLSKAPAAFRDYDVWIARYGAYKPWVKLLHWQLTPYGRVRGIAGEVDINVFNGTRTQFEEYLKTVRKQ